MLGVLWIKGFIIGTGFYAAVGLEKEWKDNALGVGLNGWKSRSYIAERENPMRIRTDWSMYRHTERMDNLGPIRTNLPIFFSQP